MQYNKLIIKFNPDILINSKKVNRNILIIVLIFIIIVLAYFLLIDKRLVRQEIGPLGKNATIRKKPLDKYSFDNLRKRKFEESAISLGKQMKKEADFSSYIFYFQTGGKKVSGLINLPVRKNDVEKISAYPVVVMLRGYVDQKKYYTGLGTMHVGEYFARHRIITLAPDFLGYGESDKPSSSPMEERFETYITALTLLSSIKNLNKTFQDNNLDLKANESKIGIWGHSNGGQIALSVLELIHQSYPTVLWAPVSKPFPYSILYFTDDADDHGKTLRKLVADFEKDYDSEKYSMPNYLDRINSPIQLHQGATDESVPLRWSDELNAKLKKLGKDIAYFVYQGNDHNLSQSWLTVVKRNVEFYKGEL